MPAISYNIPRLPDNFCVSPGDANMEQGGRKKTKYLVLIFYLFFCLVSTNIYKHTGTSIGNNRA